MNIQIRYLLVNFVIIAFVLAPSLCFANPEGGVVAAGEATILESGSNLTINQASDRAVIDWRNFDIAPNEATQFNQPSSDSVTLNRIHSDHASTIAGKLTANGNIVLVNQNGFLFTKDAVVDVNGIIATTSDIENDKFMQGKMEFTKPGNADAMIINEGKITAKQAGLVGMVAPQVINNGYIVANGGRVQLSSGDSFTVDLYGDKLMEVAVSKKLRKQLVKNKGIIKAKGGKILLTAAAGKEIVDGIIEVEGELKAPAAGIVDGEIVIYAEGSNAVPENIPEHKGIKQGKSKVTVAAKLNASGRNNGEKGGKISILADEVNIKPNSIIDASGLDGLTGTTEGFEVSAERIGSAGGDIRIGGDYKGGGTTPTAEKLIVEPGAEIYSDSLSSGDAGRNIFWADNIAIIGGSHAARALGKSGNGGFIETSGHSYLQIDDNIKISTKAESGKLGTWLLDPGDITITAATNFQVTGATPFIVNGAGAPTLSAATIVAALNTPTNVIIQTTNDVYSTNGDILVNSPIIAVGTGSLTLLAFRDIQINSAISLGGGNLTLTAANNYNAGADTNRGSVEVNAGISTTGTGNITISGYGSITGASTNGIDINNVVLTGTGNIALTGWGINAGSGIRIVDAISTNSPGAINITGKNIVSANNPAPAGQGVGMCCSTVASGTSNITITAQGTGNFDVYLQQAELIQNSGTITIQAQCSLTAVACGGIDFAEGGTINGNLIVNAGTTGLFGNNAFPIISSSAKSLTISTGTFSLNVANFPDFGSIVNPFSTITLTQATGNFILDVNAYATGNINVNALAGGINLSGTYKSTAGSVNFSPSTNIITLDSNGLANSGVTTISAASSVTLPTTIVGTTNGVESLSVTGGSITMPSTIGSNVGPVYLSSASLNTTGAASSIDLSSITIYANNTTATTQGATANITTSGAYTLLGNTTLTSNNAAVSLNAGGVSGNFNFTANSYSSISLPVISTKSIAISTTGAAADISTNGTQTSNGGVITFSAYRDININNDANTTSSANVTLTSDNGSNSSGAVNVSANITSNGGNITMTGGSGFAYGSSVNVNGVYINSSVNSAAGNILIKGKGWIAGTTISSSGIYVDSSASFNAAGTITMTGYGGVGTTSSANYGIYTNAGITGTNNIMLTGTGGTGSGLGNDGVNIDSTTISSNANGAPGQYSITLIGTGGVNDGGNGVSVTFSSILAINKTNINITGNGGGAIGSSSGGNRGISTDFCTIQAADGNITMVGIGGNTQGDYNYGIYPRHYNTTGSGNIILTGTGGGNGPSSNNHGIYGGDVVTSGTGSITITGTGGGSSSIGVYLLLDTNGSNSGDITITGTGAASGSSNDGVNILVPLGTTNVGSTINITGTGGGAAGINNGVTISSTIDSGTSATTITGQYGFGGYDIYLDQNIATTGTTNLVSSCAPCGTIYVNNAYTLAGNMVINAGATGTAQFNNTLNGAKTLGITAATLTPNGAWGGVTPLGNITFNSAFILGNNLTTTSSGTTNITSTVNGGFNLNITSNAISQGGIIGGGAALNSVTLNSAIAMSLPFNISTNGAILAETTAGNITTSASYTSTGGSVTIFPAGVASMILAADTTINAPTISIPTAIDGTVNYNESLTLISTGTITLGGAIGGTVPLKDVSITAGNTITIPAITANSIFVRTTGAAANIITGGNLNTGATTGTGLVPAATIGATNVAGYSYGVFLYPGLDLDNSGAYTITTKAATYWAVMTGDSAITNIIKGGLVAPQYLGCSYANPITCTTPALVAANGLNAFLFTSSTINLTISGTSIINKVYDGTSIAYLNQGSLVGVLLADIPNVILTENGSYAQVNVGNGITV